MKTQEVWKNWTGEGKVGSHRGELGPRRRGRTCGRSCLIIYLFIGFVAQKLLKTTVLNEHDLEQDLRHTFVTTNNAAEA